MQPSSTSPALFRTAGLLYLAIIGLGLSGELAVRLPLAGLAPDALATQIARTELAFRLSIAADTLMVVADIALAGLLYILLSKVSPMVAGIAALFRLVQAATIAANLTNQQAALAWALDGQGELAATALSLHATGYDTGLIFFGVNTLLTGWLLIRHDAFPNWLGTLLGLAGATYLTGSYLRILAPDLALMFQPAYLIAIIAETSFALALLRRGRFMAKEMVGDERFELPTSSM